MLSAAVDIDAGLRTDEEVRFYFDNGWVKLERLISRDFAAEDGNRPNGEPDCPMAIAGFGPMWG